MAMDRHNYRWLYEDGRREAADRSQMPPKDVVACVYTAENDGARYCCRCRASLRKGSEVHEVFFAMYAPLSIVGIAVLRSGLDLQAKADLLYEIVRQMRLELEVTT